MSPTHPHVVIQRVVQQEGTMDEVSRPERVLRRARVGIAVLALLELAAVIMAHGWDRLIMAGALVGACLSLAVIRFGLARLRTLVARIGDPPGAADADRPWFTAQMLEGFPMDQLPPSCWPPRTCTSIRSTRRGRAR
jgi:hypothetical protein